MKEIRVQEIITQKQIEQLNKIAKDIWVTYFAGQYNMTEIEVILGMLKVNVDLDRMTAMQKHFQQMM